MSSHLDARIEAEEKLDVALARITELETRLRGALGADPTSATRALAWMQRAEQAETLLLQLNSWLNTNPSVNELLPAGFHVRLGAQLKTVEILRRDQREFGERPPDEQWWEQFGQEDLRIAEAPERPEHPILRQP